MFYPRIIQITLSTIIIRHSYTKLRIVTKLLMGLDELVLAKPPGLRAPVVVVVPLQ